MINGIMRGLGNSRTPLIILIITSITNVVLTLMFVLVFNWGIAGSAYGTILSQFLSMVLIIIALHRANPLTRISLKELKLNAFSAKEVLKLGMPTGIQQVVMSISGVVIQGFVNSYGTVNIAGYGAASKVDMFAFMPIMSFGHAMTSYTGQNVGAGNMERVRKGANQGVVLGLVVIAVMSALLLTLGRYALMLFTDDVQTIEAGYTMIRTVVPFYSLVTLNQLICGVMRGVGETVKPMINALMTSLIVRIPTVILLNYLLGRIEGIYISQVIGWAYGCISILLIYRKGGWKKKALEKIKSLHAGEAM